MPRKQILSLPVLWFIYNESQKGVGLKDLAERFGVAYGSLRTRLSKFRKEVEMGFASLGLNCAACGGGVLDKGWVSHHTSYYPEQVIPLHTKCHGEVHAGQYQQLMPPDGHCAHWQMGYKQPPRPGGEFHDEDSGKPSELLELWKDLETRSEAAAIIRGRMKEGENLKEIAVDMGILHGTLRTNLSRFEARSMVEDPLPVEDPLLIAQIQQLNEQIAELRERLEKVEKRNVPMRRPFSKASPRKTQIVGILEDGEVYSYEALAEKADCTVSAVRNVVAKLPEDRYRKMTSMERRGSRRMAMVYVQKI